MSILAILSAEVGTFAHPRSGRPRLSAGNPGGLLGPIPLHRLPSVEVAKALLQALQVRPLRPMFRVTVQAPEIHSVGFPPAGDREVQFVPPLPRTKRSSSVSVVPSHCTLGGPAHWVGLSLPERASADGSRTKGAAEGAWRLNEFPTSPFSWLPRPRFREVSAPSSPNPDKLGALSELAAVLRAGLSGGVGPEACGDLKVVRPLAGAPPLLSRISGSDDLGSPCRSVVVAPSLVCRGGFRQKRERHGRYARHHIGCS